MKKAHTAVSEITLPQISLTIIAASYEKYLIHISHNYHRRKHKSFLKPLLFSSGCCWCFKSASLLSLSLCANLQDPLKGSGMDGLARV